MELDPNQAAYSVGKIPSGTFVLTTSDGQQSTGVLVSWVQQASFEPLAITVAVKRGRPVTSLIGKSNKFLLNLVGEDTITLFRHFGKGFTLEESAFSGLKIGETEFGPALVDCQVHIACKVLKQLVEVGDHDLYFAEVLAGQVAKNAKPYVHIRRSGSTY